MSTPEHREVALLLLSKARADLSAARLLADDDHQNDGVIGFHAQQAAEKAIKAVLADSEVEIPRTHDLGYLLELVESSGRPDVEVPQGVEDVVWLNPWAVTMRYDELESPLDRRAALASAEVAVAWADGLMASSR